MKIHELFVENIKRIKVFEVSVDPEETGAIILEGKNAQGKTSVMDSIGYLLGGERLIPNKVMRDGSKSAEIKADLGDIIVTRKWKEDGTSQLEIRTKDGAKVRAPQAFLDEKIRLATLDPLNFCRLKSTERVEELKKIPGLDCSEEDAKYEEYYGKRHLINRDLDKAKKNIEEYKGITAPKGVRAIEKIRKDLDTIEKINAESERYNQATRDMLRDFEDLKKEFTKKTAEVTEIEKTIEVLTAKGNKLTQESEKLMEDAAALKSKINDSVEKVLADTKPLKDELEVASEFSATMEKIARRDTLQNEIETLTTQTNDVDDEMKAIAARKKAKIAAFNLPVKGLEIGKTDILFDGIPFDNLSQAQKIEIATALAIAQNPTVKIIKISEGSFFDEDALAALIKYINGKGFQVWIERVANTPSGNAIFIEDGEVKK